MQTFHYKWILAGIAAGVFLVLGFVLAYGFRETGETANFSSIWGLWVSLIGFALTIYSLYEVQRASRQAQEKVAESVHRAEQTVEEARKETRQAMQAIRREVLHSDHSTLLVFLHGLKDAALRQQWELALFCASQSPRLVSRVAMTADLPEAECTELQGWADDLRSVEAFIRKNRIGKTETGSLQSQHLTTINTIIARLDIIGRGCCRTPWR